MEVLDYLIKLTDKHNRQETALEIANVLKADDLIIFIKDQDLDLLLPGPGFPQRLSNGKGWRQFLTQGEESIFRGEVPYHEKMYPAVAVRTPYSTAVLIGGKPGEEEIALLHKILATIAPLLKQEQLTQVAESKALHNAKLTEKAERLTSTLDSIRNNLTKLLDENTHLLRLTHQQNQELAAANEELSASNEEITAGLEELNSTNLRLISINADLDNFIYTASHDLKSPIANIEGLIKMLTVKLKQNGWENEMVSKIINMIGLSISRFKGTISDLTEIAKTGQEFKMDPIPVNLVDLINEVKNDLYIIISESGAQITINIEQDVYILFSRKNLKSILYNLLSNAIKYGDAKRAPLIHIDWYPEDEYDVLCIADNGIGIEPKYQDKIFGLFKRFHTHVEGTGIGLYIVKKVIDDAGGMIRVESIAGSGTTFRVYFKRKLLPEIIEDRKHKR